MNLSLIIIRSYNERVFFSAEDPGCTGQPFFRRDVFDIKTWAGLARMAQRCKADQARRSPSFVSIFMFLALDIDFYCEEGRCKPIMKRSNSNAARPASHAATSRMCLHRISWWQPFVVHRNMIIVSLFSIPNRLASLLAAVPFVEAVNFSMLSFDSLSPILSEI